MPLTQPAYPPGPYRFCDREYLIITYRTDRAKLAELVPEPLEVVSDPQFEFIRMPDSTGSGDYTEAGQVIPVRFGARTGNYTLNMFLNDHARSRPASNCGFRRVRRPHAAGGNRHARRNPRLRADPVATGTMGFKHKQADSAATLEEFAAPTSCSSSFRTWTEAPAFASSSNIIWRTSN